MEKMNLEQYHISATDTTPEVLLTPGGTIKIKGRAISEDISKVPKNIMEWIDTYVTDPAERTEVIIALEFLNSFNTIIITSYLKKTARVLSTGKSLDIKWYYEKDDEDILERAEYISITINVPIQFIPVDNISNY